MKIDIQSFRIESSRDELPSYTVECVVLGFPNAESLLKAFLKLLAHMPLEIDEDLDHP